MENLVLDTFAQAVRKYDVHFLDYARRRTRRNNAMVGKRRGASTVTPAENNTRHALRTALFQRLYDVYRHTGRRDAEKHVLRSGLAGNLPSEYLLKAIIVPDSGQN